jgi:hypothetical protein
MGEHLNRLEALRAAQIAQLHWQLAGEAGRCLEAQSLRPPTAVDIRTPYAERSYEGRPLLSYDDDFLRSLGIKPCGS